MGMWGVCVGIEACRKCDGAIRLLGGGGESILLIFMFCVNSSL